MDHSALRARILAGLHAADVKRQIELQVGSARADKWGEPDLTCSVARSAYEAQATLYDRRPTLVADDSAAAYAFEAALDEAGLFAMLPGWQSDVLALRDGFMRPEGHTTEHGAELTFRMVQPQYVDARGTASAPDVPVYLAESRLLSPLDGGDTEWVREVYDVGGKAPRFHIEDRDGKECTARFDTRGVLEGDAYTWRHPVTGEPIVPYGAYHARRRARMFGAFERLEVWEGNLNVSVLTTMWRHGMRSGCWPQRNVANGRLVNVGDENTAVADSAIVLQWEAREEGQAISHWQDAAAMDPEVTLRAIHAYERRVAAQAGLNPADVERISGDPRSGYALAVNRSAQREAAARFEPIFEPADRGMLAVAASEWFRVGGAEFDTSALAFRYAPIPKSGDEARAEVDRVTQLVDRGLLDPVDAYVELHGVDRDTAEDALARIAESRRRFTV